MWKTEIDSASFVDMIETSWLEFIRFSLDKDQSIPNSVSTIDWENFYEFAQKQCIVGILFDGISRLGYKPAYIPRKVLISWGVHFDMIQKQNKRVNEAAGELPAFFNKDGYRCVILKGQGNNLLYPSPFSRMSGDIDIWITPTDNNLTESQRERNCLQYLRSKFPNGNLHYNHIDAGHFRGIKVEVHHRPRFLNNLVYNRRLQKWIISCREEQFQHLVSLPDGAGEVAIPTIEFNIIFQLAHIYGHLLQEGIGLRHIIDYYYVLKANQGKEKNKLCHTLKHLGLWNISGAVSWVMHNQLGLDADYLLTPQDSVRGRFLWREMLLGGNFGHFNEDNLRVHSKLGNNLRRLKRDVSLLRYFPSECISEPIFRLYHYLWRLKYN